jgi:outer membrane receptor protein involved in Fe transport
MKKVKKAFATRMARQLCASLAAGTAVLGALPLMAAELVDEQPAAQQDAGDAGAAAQAAPPADGIEEMVVSGRQRSSAADVVTERLTMDVAVDLLGIEQIGRVGDGTVAAALRRVPGVTLVNDQFIYVRGLGERYVSSRLNGAVVPSPDLTRDVLPLDIFPTSIIESLSVQKAYSPDAPAAFGGGSIDIRTRSIPEQPVFEVSIGSGLNGDSRDKGLQYTGGDDDAFGEDACAAWRDHRCDPALPGRHQPREHLPRPAARRPAAHLRRGGGDQP